MKLELCTLFILVGVATAACSGSDDTGGDSAAGSGGAAATSTTVATTAASTTTASTGGGGDGGGTGGAGGEAAAAPEAPVMKGVAQMSGALHVTWQNVATDCDAVHLMRNEDGATFAHAYTLAGSATSKHDTQATSGATTYCYMAQCERGGVMSPESNEKCGSP